MPNPPRDVSESPRNNRLEQAPLNGDIYQTDGRTISQMRSQTDTSTPYVPQVELVNDLVKHGMREPSEKQFDDARKEFPGLLDKLGPDAQRAGMTMENIKTLKTKDLTGPQLQALEYFEKNFDKFKTDFHRDGWNPLTRLLPFSDYEPWRAPVITLESLNNGRNEAQPVDKLGPLRTKPEPFDPLNPDARDRQSPTERQRGRDVEVQAGWGWGNVAQKSLQDRGNQSPSAADVSREMERLQRLNPDKVKMLHPNDKIRTQ